MTDEINLNSIIALVIKNPGSTASELHKLSTGYSKESFIRLLMEAKLSGVIRAGGDRFCTEEGRNAVMWWPSE